MKQLYATKPALGRLILPFLFATVAHHFTVHFPRIHDGVFVNDDNFIGLTIYTMPRHTYESAVRAAALCARH